MLKSGKRDVENNCFIEPSTGRLYTLDASPYEVVDCVFNNHNFWINLNPEKEVKDVNFNIMDEDLEWEYVMLDTLGKID